MEKQRKRRGTFRKVDPADQGAETIRRTLVVTGPDFVSRVVFQKHRNRWECISAQEPLSKLSGRHISTVVYGLLGATSDVTWKWEE